MCAVTNLLIAAAHISLFISNRITSLVICWDPSILFFHRDWLSPCSPGKWVRRLYLERHVSRKIRTNCGEQTCSFNHFQQVWINKDSLFTTGAHIRGHNRQGHYLSIKYLFIHAYPLADLMILCSPQEMAEACAFPGRSRDLNAHEKNVKNGSFQL